MKKKIKVLMNIYVYQKIFRVIIFHIDSITDPEFLVFIFHDYIINNSTLILKNIYILYHLYYCICIPISFNVFARNLFCK